MRILFGSPIFSQWHDAGLFWADALCRQGHSLILWDYRLHPHVPQGDYDAALIMKGESIYPKKLHGPKAVYWPDAFERDPHAINCLRGYDAVFTPVRPTPTGAIWLPTGWAPGIHRRIRGDPYIDTVFIGTHSQRKEQFLKVIQPGRIHGNGWPQAGWGRPPIGPLDPYPPVYLHELVETLSFSKIAVNIHRDEIGLNRRFFEFIACAFTITDWVPGVEEVLGPRLTKQVAFKTPEEGRKMVECYLQEPALREELWRNELDAIRLYTYDAAAKRVVECLKSLL